MQNMGCLCLLATQKFFSSRQVEEQRAHFHRCSRSASAVRDRLDFPACDLDFRSSRSLGGACHQTESGDARNTRHRLPAKTHGADIRQIGSRPNLARGMPLQAEQRILAIHPRAVVLDPNQLRSSSGELHTNPPRTCIDAIFHQFLDHRSRALHDLTRRNLACDFVCEQADLSHVV